MTSELAYRADIDGLRAVAVVAVIASHLPEKLLPSGFLGVDVFFAISGFVVTASLLGQREMRLVPLYIGFLSRRVKRLLPALALCVTVTGLVVLAADPFPQHSIQTGIAALFGSANFALFFFELDYFSPSSLFNAFTHTWSLGVEEQFYVVFPLYVWMFYFSTQQTSFKLLAWAMILGGSFSVLLFVLLYETHQAAAFFMMPTRIWELGVGALVFLASDRIRDSRWLPRLRTLAPIFLAGLLACFFMPEDHIVLATLVAVGLTGLLLAADSQSPAARLLMQPPVVYIGRISYSLYLWHWPMIALGPIVLPTAWRLSVLYVVATAVVAALSYHWVERPLRYWTWTPWRAGDIGLGIAGNLIVASVLTLTALAVVEKPGSSTNSLYPPAYLPVLDSGKTHVLTCALDGGSRIFTATTIDDCTVPPEPGSGMPTIWAMGDSHSGHLQGMLHQLHERLGAGIHLVETPGWSFPLPAGQKFAPREEVYAGIYPRFEAGDIVLISRKYISRFEPHTIEELRPWLYNVSRLAEDLADKGVKLVITGPPPIFPFRDVRECNLDTRKSCRLDRARFSRLVDQVMLQLNELKARHPNVEVFDIFSAVCPARDRYCYPDDGSTFLYRDRDHFNSLGSKRLAKPFVDLLRSSELIERR